MEKRDLYSILGITQKASPDEVKKTYRKLSLKYHPDKNPGDSVAEEKFKDLAFAYSILSDPDKRQRYDLTGSTSDEAPIYETPRYDVRINVDYEELILGGQRGIKIKESILVDKDGNEIEKVNCSSCRGRGGVQMGPIRLMCGRCGGQCKIYVAEGTQKQKVQIINLNIPPKSWPFRVVEADEKKILLEPKFSQKKRLRHEDTTIVYTHQITVFHALVGLVKEITVLDQTHKINHPEPITPETMIAFENGGLYDSRGYRGNLIVVFDILYPNVISIEQRKCIERCIAIDNEEEESSSDEENAPREEK